MSAVCAAWFIQNIGLGVGDCGWSAPVRSWVDDDGNGTWDEGEAPLEFVAVHVNDVKNDYRDVGLDTAVTDWNGETRVTVWLPGCPKARFEVYALAPEGYQALRPDPVPVLGPGYGSSDLIQFPFAELSGHASPTPYVAKLQCADLGSGAADLAVAEDGSLWSLSLDGVTHWDAGGRLKQSYSFDSSRAALFSRIWLDRTSAVWAFDRPAGLLAQLAGAEWRFAGKSGGILGAAEPPIGTSSDGTLWFATADKLISYNPTTAVWHLHSTRWVNTAERYAATALSDGISWLAAFGDRVAVTATVPSAWSDWAVVSRHEFEPAEASKVPMKGWVKHATLAPDGTVWVDFSSGLAGFDPEHGTWRRFERGTADFPLIGGEVDDLYAAPDGAIWLAASERGHVKLLRLVANLDPQSAAVWTSFDPRDGIPDVADIVAIAAGRDGAVWLGRWANDLLVRCQLRGEAR